jgi:glycosyltransferase involved in cell wall biosynthesis
MRIAQIAPQYEAVPPRLYGGTERVVGYLTDELVRQGHDVTLFASADSVTLARLHPVAPRALRLDPRCVDPLAWHVLAAVEAYRRAREFDVIHAHVDYFCLPHTAHTRTPTLLTLHGRLDIPDLAPLYEAFPNVVAVSISDAQRKPLPQVDWAATIHHGLPPDLYALHPGPGKYLAFIGRISPEKAPHDAIHAAIRAEVPIRIAAKVDRADEAYFKAVVRPLLDHPLVEFIGEIGENEKGEFLGNALALMLPIDWPEPFGLAMIEAMACGTPVITRARGSVPEVLEEGVTGLYGETVEDLARAVTRAAALDRAAIRREFERRFTVSMMARRYVEVYESLQPGKLPRGR